MMAYIGTYIFYNNNKILLLYLIYMRNLGGGGLERLSLPTICMVSPPKKKIIT